MRRISDMEGLPITGRKGKTFGRIEHVLFAPSEPRVVGYEVRPPAIGYVIDRKSRYVLLAAVERTPAGLALRTGDSSKRPTFSWDESVVWRYMPVLSEGGRSLGFVRDAEFDEADGTLGRLWLSHGAADDVAVGGRSIDGGSVLRFDGEAVVVSDEAAAARSSGGAARSAGHGAAIAKVAAGETARQAIGGAVRAVKVVQKADITKRAKGGWKALRDSIAEGWKEDE